MRQALFYPVILASVFLVPALVRAEPATKPAQISPDDQKILDRSLAVVRFNANGFSDVVQFLRDITGVNIYVDWLALDTAGIKGDAPITLRAQNEKLSQVLAAVLASAAKDQKGLSFDISQGIIVVSTPDGIERRQKLLAAHDKDGDLLAKRLPEVRFNANEFSDAIDFVRDVAGLNITVDWDALEKAGVKKDAPITLRLRDVPLGRALQLIAAEASNDKTQVDYRVDGDKIELFSVPIKDE